MPTVVAKDLGLILSLFFPLIIYSVLKSGGRDNLGVGENNFFFKLKFFHF